MRVLEGRALNPSSVHGAGRAAKKILEDARNVIADGVSVFPAHEVEDAPNPQSFTSYGTPLEGEDDHRLVARLASQLKAVEARLKKMEQDYHLAAEAAATRWEQKE